MNIDKQTLLMRLYVIFFCYGAYLSLKTDFPCLVGQNGDCNV